MGGFPSGQREQTVNLPSQTSMVRIHPCPPFFAGMAELADALDSGSSESNFMQVQVLFPAPNQYNPNLIFQIGNGFGFFLIFLSQRYNTRDLASMVSMQGAEIPRNPCEIMIQQSSYRDILLLRNMVYWTQQILLMFVKNFFLEVAQKKGRTKWTHQIAGFEKMM